MIPEKQFPSTLNSSLSQIDVLLSLCVLSFQVWSITYHSWLTFAYLLAACTIWMLPEKRRFCLGVSPLIVCYAEALLTMQYVYGFNLTDTELPTETSTGYKFKEIGLVRYNYVCLHLGLQVWA